MYTNGLVPEGLMATLGSGKDRYGTWKHLLPPGTAARWRWMVGQAKAKYGVTLRITPGWNAYRPLRIQKLYRSALGIMAAVPGSSSHGGNYRGRQSMAIDVANWTDLAPGNRDLAWGRFKALCRLAGFTTDFVTPQELWHIGDLGNPWVVPAWLRPKPAAVPIKQNIEGEDDMVIYVKAKGDTVVYELFRGKKRRVGAAEWKAIKAGHVAGKVSLPYSDDDLTKAELASIPSA